MSTVRSPRLLTSHERIAQQFGSYGVDVIESDGRHRVSSLYSLSDGGKVCRTYAVVCFSETLDPAFTVEHLRVIEGQSIGAVFKSAGWTIAKRHTSFAETTIAGRDNDILVRMKIAAPQRLASHSYVFEIEKNGRRFDYAEITEMHHPEYLSKGDLLALYGSDLTL